MPVSRPAAHQLGAELRTLREAAGLTLRALEAQVGFSNATISLWENGHRLPSIDNLGKILDVLGVSGDERERLLGMRREADGPGQLVSGTPSIGKQLSRLIEQEQIARRITEVAPLLIPGLLQTSNYARTILRRDPDASMRVALRAGRQKIITRSREPVKFHALIDTEVLTRPIAPLAVIAEQLHHLLKMAERPNVMIQLVSSTQSGYTPMLAGPFILLEFPTATPIVHLEHYRASTSLWGKEDVRGFVAAVEEITQKAMTPERSSEVIAELVNGLETTT